MDHHRNAESGGDRVDGYVVVSRPDSTGREKIIVGLTKGIYRCDNRVLPVGDDTDLAEADSLLVQPRRDLRDVAILRPP